MTGRYTIKFTAANSQMIVSTNYFAIIGKNIAGAILPLVGSYRVTQKNSHHLNLNNFWNN